MRVYVAYQLAGHSVKKQSARLKEISEIIKEIGLESFIFLKDIQNWNPSGISPKEIMKKAEENMRKSDIILAVLETAKKSEGMLLECGYMKALGKKLIVASRTHEGGVLLKALADNVFEFSDNETFKKGLKEAISNLE